MTYTPKDATPATAAANRAAVEQLDLDDRQDFADADRDLIAPFPDKLYAQDGRVIFDPARFDYLADDAPAPDSVHPSLWRQSQLIRKGGCTRSWTASTGWPRTARSDWTATKGRCGTSRTCSTPSTPTSPSSPPDRRPPAVVP